MLKVFLVEDEIIIREGIKNNIDWQKNGFIFSGEASDGEIAFSMISQIKPDIVITDIKMPFMDGLELGRLIKKEFSNIKIIILSGYDEFEYAKQAIGIGVEEYLVKPISSVKLLDTVKKVANIINEEYQQQQYLENFKNKIKEDEIKERDNLFSLLINKKYSIAELFEKGRKYNVDLLATKYNVLLFNAVPKEDNLKLIEERELLKSEIKELIKNKKDIIMFERGIEGIAFLIKEINNNSIKNITKSYIKSIENISKKYSNLEYFGGLGCYIERLTEINKSYENASKAFAYRYILEKNQIIKYDELKNYYIEKNNQFNLNNLNFESLDRKIIKKFLVNGSKNEIEFFINEYFNGIGLKNIESLLFRQYITMDIYFCAVEFLESIGGNSSEFSNETNEDLTNILVSLEETKKYLINIFEKIIKFRDEKSSNKYRNILFKATEYINENYNSENITLNDIANIVNISPNHFSAIFSQEMNKTFVEYLTDIRMDKAKELLKCTGLRSSEIAYKVGYKDPHYFSYIFKKTQGCSPKEYRNENKKHT